MITTRSSFPEPFTPITGRVDPSRQRYESREEARKELLAMLSWFWPTPENKEHSAKYDGNGWAVVVVIQGPEGPESRRVEAAQIQGREDARRVVQFISSVYPAERLKTSAVRCENRPPQFGLT